MNESDLFTQLEQVTGQGPYAGEVAFTNYQEEEPRGRSRKKRTESDSPRRSSTLSPSASPVSSPEKAKGSNPHQRIRQAYRTKSVQGKYGSRDEVLPSMEYDRGKPVPLGFLGPYRDVMLYKDASAHLPKTINYESYPGGPQLEAPMNNVARRFFLLNPAPNLTKYLPALALMHKHGLGNLSARDNYLFHTLPHDGTVRHDPYIPWRSMIMKADDRTLEIMAALVGRATLPQLNKQNAKRLHKFTKEVQDAQASMSKEEKDEDNMQRYTKEQLTDEIPSEEELIASMKPEPALDNSHQLMRVSDPDAMIQLDKNGYYTHNRDSPHFDLHVRRPHYFPGTNKPIPYQERQNIRGDPRIAPVCDEETAILGSFINSFRNIHDPARAATDVFTEEHLKALPHVVEGYKSHCGVPRRLIRQEIREGALHAGGKAQEFMMNEEREVDNPKRAYIYYMDPEMAEKEKEKNQEPEKIPPQDLWYGPKYEHPKPVPLNPFAVEEFQERLNMMLRRNQQQKA
jgi:hypothetical protein